MDRIEQYAIDSFFINGGPAPTVLLTSFGITQGQISGAQYAYNFYRKGTYAYLMRFFYGADKTFTTVSQAYVNTDDVLTGIGDPQQPSYTTLVFPNPSNTDITINYNLKKSGMVEVFLYNSTGQEIIQLSGGQKSEGKHSVKWNRKNGSGQTVSPGLYYVRIIQNGQAYSAKVVVY